MKSRGRTTRTIRSGWTIRHRTLHTQARIMSRGRISSRPAQETGAAAFSRRCKGPAQCHATQAREFPGTSRHALSRGRAGDTAHTSRTMGGGIWIACAQEKALRSPRGPCGALLGQIALLARPHALARRAARERELLSLAKNLTSQNSQS